MSFIRFRRKTVDDIVAPIQRIVNALEEHAAQHLDEAELHEHFIERHREAQAENDREAAKAREHAEKIKALLP